jgi:hypothetical protein
MLCGTSSAACLLLALPAAGDGAALHHALTQCDGNTRSFALVDGSWCVGGLVVLTASGPEGVMHLRWFCTIACWSSRGRLKLTADCINMLARNTNILCCAFPMRGPRESCRCSARHVFFCRRVGSKVWLFACSSSNCASWLPRFYTC